VKDDVAKTQQEEVAALSDQETELLFACEVAVATEVRALAPNCVSAVWNLLHGTLLAPEVLSWLPDV
jgi:hypothetical protein